MYKKVAICGSMRFVEDMIEVQKHLSYQGVIVLMPSFTLASPGTVHIPAEIKKQFAEMHRERIDMADEIFVVNVGGYFGSDTDKDIEYAESVGKPVKYLEGLRTRVWSASSEDSESGLAF
jgi:hypothetical protein